VPTYRPDLERIPVYRPGKPIDEVSRELGLDDIAKLASNESPYPPFPEVQRVVAEHAAGLNRYPENSGYRLVTDLAAHLGVEFDEVWLGAGSTQILLCTALAVGGPGTSAVFADPSFVMYPIATLISGAEPIRVPLDGDLRIDLDALAAAVREDTTVVYLCNPNNPTGTYLPATAVARVLDRIPERVLVVVDEAYHEYVTAEDHATAVPLARERRNVLVTRTFSKIYGLAGLRIGYGVAAAETITALRRTQVPFAANSLAQVAAQEALRHDELVTERRKLNAVGREEIERALAARGLRFAPSQANFVAVEFGADAPAIADQLLRLGVIVRPLGDLVRVTVGTAAENARLLAALDRVATER